MYTLISQYSTYETILNILLLSIRLTNKIKKSKYFWVMGCIDVADLIIVISIKSPCDNCLIQGDVECKIFSSLSQSREMPSPPPITATLIASCEIQ